MELKLVDGEVRWVNKTGVPLKKRVNIMRVIEYMGFPSPYYGRAYCKSMNLLCGDPCKDDRLIVGAGGNKWFAYFLLEKSGSYTQLDYGVPDLLESGAMQLDNAEEFPFQTGKQKRFMESEEVDPDALREEMGLVVYEDKFEVFEGEEEVVKWIKDKKQFVRDIPEGWIFIRKGDAQLTRAITKEHPHWQVYHRNAFKHWDRAGIFADENVFLDTYVRLGGDVGAEKRNQSKREAQIKAERRITDRLAESIRSQFPKIPDEDLQNILGTCRRTGCVGNSSDLYFSSAASTSAAFESSAHLATRAYVRHEYTKYDSLLAEGYPKELARQKVGMAIEKKLNEWT
jgi:hypothetical protein